MTHYTYFTQNGVRHARTVLNFDGEKPEVISGFIDKLPVGIFVARLPVDPRSVKGLEDLLRSVDF